MSFKALPLVDTDVWIDFLRGTPQAVAFVKQLPSDVAQTGGLIRRDFGKSHGLGLNDALIAATAVHSKACLYTLNLKHYPSLSQNQVQQAYRKP